MSLSKEEEARTKHKRWSDANRSRINEQQAVWRAANKDKVAAARLKHRYGIVPEQRDEMLKAQGNVCAICETDTPTGVGWVVDHDHGTNEVRQILCTLCNTGIGYFKDNPALLRAAAAYLERHKNGGQQEAA